MEIEYKGKITCEKIVIGVWAAKIQSTKPFNCEVTMKGNSAEDAVKKLEYFLDHEYGNNEQDAKTI